MYSSATFGDARAEADEVDCYEVVVSFIFFSFAEVCFQSGDFAGKSDEEDGFVFPFWLFKFFFYCFEDAVFVCLNVF